MYDKNFHKNAYLIDMLIMPNKSKSFICKPALRQVTKCLFPMESWNIL